MNNDNIAKVITNCKNFKNASSASIEKLISFGMVKRYKGNETVFREREGETRIYILISGFVSLFKVNKNLDKRTIYILGKNEILNEVIFDGGRASSTCVALGCIEVLSFPKEQFMQLMQSDFEISKMVVTSMAKKIRRLYRQIANSANSMYLNKKIVAKLWKLGTDFGTIENKIVTLPFPMTISFLAEMVGSKRETVSRVIKKLAEENILNIQNGKCQIFQPEKLKELMESAN